MKSCRIEAASYQHRLERSEEERDDVYRHPDCAGEISTVKIWGFMAEECGSYFRESWNELPV